MDNLLYGNAGDEFIDGTGEVTTGFFAVLILEESTVTKCEVDDVDVLTARNYGTLPANYVIWAGETPGRVRKITSIQFSGTPKAQGFKTHQVIA